MATIYSTKTVSKADATQEVKLYGGDVAAETAVDTPQGVNFHKHQIAIDKNGNTSGTITVLCTPKGASTTEAVYEDGSAIVINLATAGEPLTRTNIIGCLESFSFTQASLAGGNDVTYTISSWTDD